MAVIRSAAQYRRHAQQRNAFIREAMKAAAELFTTEVVERIKQTRRFDDQTGNARGGIGILRFVAAAESRITFRFNPKRLIRRVRDFGFHIIIPAAMEYTKALNDRVRFFEETLESTFPTEAAKRQFDRAWEGVARRFGR